MRGCSAHVTGTRMDPSNNFASVRHYHRGPRVRGLSTYSLSFELIAGARVWLIRTSASIHASRGNFRDRSPGAEPFLVAAELKGKKEEGYAQIQEERRRKRDKKENRISLFRDGSRDRGSRINSKTPRIREGRHTNHFHRYIHVQCFISPHL